MSVPYFLLQRMRMANYFAQESLVEILLTITNYIPLINVLNHSKLFAQ